MKFACAPESRPLAGYTIKRAIDRGAFGEVYYALSDAGKEVALKLLHTNQEAELRGVSQCLNLKHANLVALYDIRRDDEGDAWVVMEYIAGESLEQRLSRVQGGLPVDEVLRWIDGFAAGIDYLHGKGIVHRDLKPANVFLDGGVVKIADVGLSKFMTPSRRSAQTESVGTVYYMAPEVAHGKYGRELDVYSLGVIAFEMLTGRVPFEGESTGEILMKHLAQPPDLSDIPERLRPVLARALEKDPAKRTPSAGRLAAEFRAAVTGAALPPVVAPDRVPSPEVGPLLAGSPARVAPTEESAGEVGTNVTSPVPVWLFPALFVGLLAGVMLQRASWPVRFKELTVVALAACVWKATEWWQARSLARHQARQGDPEAGPVNPIAQATFTGFLDHSFWTLRERLPAWVFVLATSLITAELSLLVVFGLSQMTAGVEPTGVAVVGLLSGAAIALLLVQRRNRSGRLSTNDEARVSVAEPAACATGLFRALPIVDRRKARFLLLFFPAWCVSGVIVVGLIRSGRGVSVDFLVPFAILMVGGLSAFFSARSRLAQQSMGGKSPASNGLLAPVIAQTVPVGAASVGSLPQQPPPLPTRFARAERADVVRAIGPRWSELFTSLAAACVLSAMVSTGLALLLPEWDAGWLALRAEPQVLSLAISTAIAASLLLAGVWWLERVPGRVRKQRTLLVVLGLLAGASVFLVDGLLGVGPAFAEPGYPGAIIDQLGRHRLVVENRATLIGMMLYFGLLFGARSWWDVLSYRRKERFDFWNALATVVIACLVVWVIQFPPTQAFLWGVTLALVLPLAATLREVKSKK
jgi:hypothetical protein